VLIGLDAGDDAGDLALRANDERGPLNSQIFSSVHALFLKHTELLGNRLIRVRQQGKRQLIGIFEFLLGRGLIARNTQHLGARTVDLLI